MPPRGSKKRPRVSPLGQGRSDATAAATSTARSNTPTDERDIEYGSDWSFSSEDETSDYEPMIGDLDALLLSDEESADEKEAEETEADREHTKLL